MVEVEREGKEEKKKKKRNFSTPSLPFFSCSFPFDINPLHANLPPSLPTLPSLSPARESETRLLILPIAATSPLKSGSSEKLRWFPAPPSGARVPTRRRRCLVGSRRRRRAHRPSLPALLLCPLGPLLPKASPSLSGELLFVVMEREKEVQGDRAVGWCRLR